MAITGLGPVSSIGIGVDDFAAGLLAGWSGIGPVASFDTTGFPHFMAGEVADFEPKSLVRAVQPDQWGRTSLFAAAAARLAVAVNRELGLTGEAVTVSTACSAANHALGYAYDQVASGEADYMVAGGADSVSRWMHAGHHRLGALAALACAPFDKDRSGTLTGEGGAALFLEPLDGARARGARVYAEVLGYGTNCAAGPAPDPGPIADCIRRAHADAGVRPGEVDYICAHGVGTPADDAAEFAAVRDVFGDRPPPISSIKSMLGHTMGAASGFGAIAAALAIARGFLPPTVNFRTPDETMTNIDPVANASRPATVDVVQNNCFAAGGTNAVTVLGRAA